MRTRDVLREAAKVIEKYGWHQNDYGNESQGFCAIGALSKAGPLADIDTAIRALQKHVRRLSIADWNDKPGRTKEEVLKALRGAARGK